MSCRRVSRTPYATAKAKTVQRGAKGKMLTKTHHEHPASLFGDDWLAPPRSIWPTATLLRVKCGNIFKFRDIAQLNPMANEVGFRQVSAG